MSLSYELNGRNGVEVSPSDIGLIIGKGASGLKRVISGAWTMYERLQSSDKRVEEEKPKLRILLKEHEGGISVEIVSASITMQKLAAKSLDRSVEFVLKKRASTITPPNMTTTTTTPTATKTSCERLTSNPSRTNPTAS